MITSTAWYNPSEIWFLVPDLVVFISQKEKTIWFFDYRSLTCLQRAQNCVSMFDAKYRYVFVV